MASEQLPNPSTNLVGTFGVEFMIRGDRHVATAEVTSALTKAQIQEKTRQIVADEILARYKDSRLEDLKIEPNLRTIGDLSGRRRKEPIEEASLPEIKIWDISAPSDESLI